MDKRTPSSRAWPISPYLQKPLRSIDEAKRNHSPQTSDETSQGSGERIGNWVPRSEP